MQTIASPVMEQVKKLVINAEVLEQNFVTNVAAVVKLPSQTPILG